MGKEIMIFNPPYWFWQKEIPDSVCDVIITEGNKLISNSGTVGHRSANTIVDTSIRNSNVAFFSSENKNSWLKAICWHYMSEANRQAWNFEITGQEEQQFTIYGVNQFYGFHEDSTNCEDGMRKLSLVISITDPSEYDAGDFEFGNGDKPDIKPRGSVIVFPSQTIHRVNAVTRGIRYSLVNWFTGPRFR